MKLNIKPFNLFLILLSFLFTFSIFNFQFSIANAQTISQQVTITYPIPQLGSCRDAKECYLYCEIPDNKSACQQFSSNTSLTQILGVSTSTFRQRVLQATSARGISFPIAELDNCDGPEACREYCSEETNREACKSYARSNNLRRRALGRISYPVDELAGCDSKQTCHAYCQEDANREACREFAKTKGIRIKKKVNSFLKKAKDELGCETLEQCKALCQDPANQTSCRNFGLKHRQLNRQNKDQIQNRIQELRSSDATPGSTRNIRNRLQNRFNDAVDINYNATPNIDSTDVPQ